MILLRILWTRAALDRITTHHAASLHCTDWRSFFDALRSNLRRGASQCRGLSNSYAGPSAGRVMRSMPGGRAAVARCALYHVPPVDQRCEMQGRQVYVKSHAEPTPAHVEPTIQGRPGERRAGSFAREVGPDANGAYIGRSLSDRAYGTEAQKERNRRDSSDVELALCATCREEWPGGFGDLEPANITRARAFALLHTFSCTAACERRPLGVFLNWRRAVRA